MTREVLPIFEHIENRQAAEALSEPFVSSEKYLALSVLNLSGLDPVAVGAAYITDEENIAYAFAMAGTVKRPYASATVFLEDYGTTVGRFHRRREEMNQLSPMAVMGNEDVVRDVANKTAADQLRTIAAFATFTFLNEHDHTSGLIVAKKATEEVPLDGRDHLLALKDDAEAPDMAILDAEYARAGISRAQVERMQQGVLHNSRSNQEFGAYACALHLPALREASKQTAMDPAVGNYFSLPRKVRRDLARQERKSPRNI